MSGYGQYNAAGYQAPNGDPRQQQQPQPGTAPFRPQVAPGSTRYQQGGSPYPQGTPNTPQSHYADTTYGGQRGQAVLPEEQGYFPPQDQPSMESAMGGLATQLGGVSLGGEGATTGRHTKKKNRHAYHNLDQPAMATQAFNQSTGNAAQYVNGDPSQQMNAGHPYAGQQVAPAMSQFPAQPTPAFSPGLQTPGQGFQTQHPQILQPSGPGVSAQGRVDPEQIPSIPRARDAAAEYYLDHIYPTMEQHLPPPASVPFVAVDQGNSSPKFARLTLNNIPSSSDTLTTTGLPLGLVLQPLACSQSGEQPIPVLDFGDIGPPRCRRCRAYINPFMVFRSGGNKLVCNMCTFPNDVSPDYFAPTDPSGIRVDRGQRPELTTGTVEYLVPKEYWAKEPVGLHWLFVLDVSQEAVTKGFLEAFCKGILEALYVEDDERLEEEGTNGEAPDVNRKFPAGSKVGFVTFDKALHFYNCNVSLVSIPDFAGWMLTRYRKAWNRPKCW